MRILLTGLCLLAVSACGVFGGRAGESASPVNPRLRLDGAMPAFPVSLAPAAAAAELGCAVPNTVSLPPRRARFQLSSRMQMPPAGAAAVVAPVAPVAAAKKDRKSVQASSEQAFEDAVRSAGDALARGDAVTAEVEYRRALELDATGTEARVALAALLLDVGRRSEAQEILGPGLLNDRRHPPLKMLQARLWSSEGLDAQALELLLREAPRADTYADYHGLAAALEQRLGRHAAAAARYRQITALRPGEGAWWVGLGISEEALGRPLAARDAYNRARNSGRLTPVLDDHAARRLAALNDRR